MKYENEAGFTLWQWWIGTSGDPEVKLRDVPQEAIKAWDDCVSPVTYRLDLMTRGKTS